ncbi:MAG: hypothetical protein ACLFNK_01840 [Candidatus Woesearchaeota archaeon]
MDIRFDGNVAEFELDFSFYDYPTIVEAAGEFTESCYVAFKGDVDGKYISVRIEPKDEDIPVRDAVFSFFNYMLGITNGKIKSVVNS